MDTSRIPRIPLVLALLATTLGSGGCSLVTGTDCDTGVSLDVRPRSLLLEVGERRALEVYAETCPDRVPARSVSAASGDPGVVAVEAPATLRGVAPGTAQVAVTAAGDLRAEVSVDVVARAAGREGDAP